MWPVSVRTWPLYPPYFAALLPGQHELVAEDLEVVPELVLLEVLEKVEVGGMEELGLLRFSVLENRACQPPRLIPESAGIEPHLRLVAQPDLEALGGISIDPVDEVGGILDLHALALPSHLYEVAAAVVPQAPG